MGLKIVKKKESSSTKRAVITILGMIGPESEAKYYFEGQKEKQEEFANMLPLLIDRFADKYKIIPIYTEAAKGVNQEVLKQKGLSDKVCFDPQYFLQDDKDFKAIFNCIDTALRSYESVIVDVSHGFRHLPILMTVDLIIHNFQDTKKVEQILFAKMTNDKNLYEIIDLKEYLEIANISFVLTSFEKNFTVASHIESRKYQTLLDSLNSVSNDLMAMNLNNLYKTSSIKLIQELRAIDTISIADAAQRLADTIERITLIKDGQKRYEIYYNLAREFLQRNYTFLSIAMLFESIRMYIKTSIKKKSPEIVTKVEECFHQDLYMIANFFKNLQHQKGDEYKRDLKNYKQVKKVLSELEYESLQKYYDELTIKPLYKAIDKTRNNLAHANIDEKNFADIKNKIEDLMNQYEYKCIKAKG